MENKDQVLLKEDLENQAHMMGFSLINVEIEMEILNNKIEIPNQKDFLNFHKNVENRLLFYSYEYVYESIFRIPDEYHHKYEEKIIQEQISVKIHEHNKGVKDIDFDKPAGLLMYYIKDGFLFYNCTSNEKIYDLSSCDYMMNYIVKEVLQEIPIEKREEMEKERQAKIEKEKEELKELIFKDPDFKAATNLPRRKSYASRFFQSHPKYKEFLLDAGYYPIHFIEDIWREFEKGLNK
ncbi:hypothetical protein [Peribacillus sp. ACCC06369]|uniref:hypothetical protein n=1 Tax=Peribacillus sp. ACCC06369 TaxID=3055860 RepID=UPI00259FE69D|nr:hypothetical protein [Peribacillus sp. ACCC06369]MDM5358376.1 hypothetical protein [Peribacillus sp. ACCC06369]